MDALEIVRRATGPAIATDDGDRILAWNHAARELLGHARGFRAEGERLHDLLAIRDVFGNRVETGELPFYEMVTQGEAPRGFELEAKNASGSYLRIAVSVVVVLGPEADRYSLVYFVRPILRRREADEVIERVLAHPNGSSLYFLSHPGDCPSRGETLTPRQIEVLRLLAQGETTEEIAGSLGISIHTVRRHVQDVLARLKVHSKAEAVSRAFSDRLI